jgi:hypothetical protein
MISSPHVGQKVQVWYRREVGLHMPLHGKVGIVRISSRGKPRNHGIIINGMIYVVPCGNLRRADK